ncbi:MAG TPA: alpha-amylase family glycosyl hydrolase [Nocardioidaceae bacterium]|nr:alpha-amylase family glycosyl hydrolase [Nocardioidaceae bacterium]
MQIPETPATSPWWKHSVCYQVYIRSFADSDGDGVGDVTGIEQRLPYLAELGVDSLWITPFYTSPQNDHGYDVADYRDVDRLFGSLEDFDSMLAKAHDLGLRVIVDLVPNHTSVEHEWFQKALHAEPGSPERDRYVFRDGGGEHGEEPPNNWQSVFGGPAWTRLEDGQWYLHMFDATQPDLNWWNPVVAEEFESILRFWLDRGVDGFRIDVAHGLFTPQEMVDVQPGEKFPMWDQPQVHEVYRRWRTILEEYDGDRMAVAEAWTDSPESMARYIRPDELQQAFNFHWLEAPWSAKAFRDVIDESLHAVGLADATATWVLSNHDVVRHVTRYGGGAEGLARGRAALLTMLALPGGAYIYQGEELGLEEVEVAPADRQDPVHFRGAGVGRDGCRVPIPWSGDEPPFGFGPGEGRPWLPQPATWGELSVAAQTDDPDSTLSFYRLALRTRREVTEDLPDGVTVLDSAPDTLAFVRGGGLVCVLNCGTESAPVPVEAGELVVASAPLEQGRIPADTAAWFRTP